VFEPRAADVVPLDIDLLELNEQTCRWPDGDGPFTFCGHAPVRGLPYCAPHSRISYQPPKERPQFSDEEIERRRRQGRANFKKASMEAA
jgi:hypothetical protein